MKLLRILDPKNERVHWWCFALLLAVLAGCTFASVGDLHLDNHDRENLLDSALISADFTYLFSTEKFHTSGRPLYEALIWLQYELWGEDMRYYHLAGVILHCAAALLLARFCRRLGWAWGMSASAGLLFFYNVSHYRAIHWSSAQCYIVSFALLCVGLWSYLSWREQARVRGKWGFYAALMGGLLVHTATITLLPLCAVLAWSRGHRFVDAVRGLILPGVLGGAGVLAIKTYYANAPQVGQISSHFDPLGHIEGLLYMVSRLVTTAFVLPFSVYELADWETTVGGLAILACFFVAWRRLPALDFWAIWIVLTPLPFLVLAPGHFFALMPGPSRYLYTASAGISVLAAAALYRLSLSPKVGRLAYVLLVPIVLLGHIHLQRAEEVSRYIAGRTQSASQNLEIAVEQLSQSIEAGGDIVPLEDAYNRLFTAMLGLGEPIADELAVARKRLPASRLLALLANVLAVEDADAAKRDGASQRIFDSIREDRSVTLERGEVDLLVMVTTYFRNRGLGLTLRGEYERAIVPLRCALLLEPGHKGTAMGWAFAHYHLGHYDEAARAWGELGDRTWVVRSWLRAVEKAPADQMLRLESARSLTEAGLIAEAVAQYRVLWREFDHAEAAFELGLLYLRLDNEDLAKETMVDGLETYGVGVAEDLGVLVELRRAKAEKQSSVAIEILRTYWPEG